MMDSVLQGKYHGLKGNQGILQNIKLAVELRSGPVELDTKKDVVQLSLRSPSTQPSAPAMLH